MDGIAAVSTRVQQIQGLVQSLGGARQVVSVTTAGSALGTTGTTRTTGTTGVPGATGTQSFEAVLSQARAASAATTAGSTGATGTSASSRTGGSRAVNGDGVPLDLARFGNGKVPADALQPLGVGNHRLWAPAAEAFTKLRAAAKADGVTIGVTDSYRSYEAQVDVARRKGLYKEGGLAAVPGTSDHGWGLSLDLRLDNKAQTWMRANAAQFGFDENTPREPWHWTFQP